MYSKIIDDAFQSGIEDAWAFWHMTPGEINGRLKAYTTKLKQKSENMDTLAFMIGNYVGIAVNNPKEYPNHPNMIKIQTINKPESEPMDDEDIKSRLSLFADIHNAIEDVS